MERVCKFPCPEQFIWQHWRKWDRWELKSVVKNKEEMGTLTGKATPVENFIWIYSSPMQYRQRMVT